ITAISTTWRTERTLEFVIANNLYHSQTLEHPAIPDVVQGSERNSQNIIHHVPPGFDCIFFVSRLISRQRQTGR
ncbi:unnamed protein product, partial [Hymenolepis diminuta]